MCYLMRNHDIKLTQCGKILGLKLHSEKVIRWISSFVSVILKLHEVLRITLSRIFSCSTKRRHDRNGYTQWLHTCCFLAHVVVHGGARTAFPSVLRENDAVKIILMRVAWSPVSIRRRAGIQPRCSVPVAITVTWGCPLVQSQPVISRIQASSALTPNNVHTSQDNAGDRWSNLSVSYRLLLWSR